MVATVMIWASKWTKKNPVGFKTGNLSKKRADTLHAPYTLLL